MSKKKLILSQEQVARICEEDSFVYLDNLASKPDIGDVYAKEVTTDGSLDDGYPEPTTTDDKSHTMTTNWKGHARLNGMAPLVVREMSKKEWSNRFLMKEETEHGNARLKGRIFGATDNGEGKSYSATKSAICRKKKAENLLNNGNEYEKQKAAKTLQRMRNNWDGLDVADTQYQAAKLNDKTVQDNKIGPKIKSAPKQSGNGKAHTPKGGVFLN